MQWGLDSGPKEGYNYIRVHDCEDRNGGVKNDADTTQFSKSSPNN